MNGLARLFLVAVMLAGAATALSACGDTWRGLKEDTGENLERSGEAMEDAGEAVRP
jgi:predicted small secreted protein